MVDGEAYEQSEMVLYKASVLAEGGKTQQALEVLERNVVSRGTHTIRVVGLFKWSCLDVLRDVLIVR